MKQIKVALTLAGLTAAALSLTACQIVYSPMAGTTFNETKYGNRCSQSQWWNHESLVSGPLRQEYLGDLRRVVHDRQG
jgi:hypothetical protein